MGPDPDESELLYNKSTKKMQFIVGTFYIILYQYIQQRYKKSMKF